MPNRLAGEKSPYLLQHAHNPVEWFPWGEEAFAKAESEDKPIFLSIGYATCHWCHVMAHESFEDPEVAELLNRDFVAIKVDREERPDVDGVYMTVCQALTGAGGWPLSVFLTPDKKPLFAGTYFPKRTSPGRPGMVELLTQISRLWTEDRPRLLKSSQEIAKAIEPVRERGQVELDQKVLEKAYWMLERSFDPRRGGFGRAPKFPTPHQLTFLLAWNQVQPQSRALAMAEKTLSAMAAGGIFDQVGLGFHRYSVDERWLVPHFEKMLYDQALLVLAYLEAFRATGKEKYAETARRILEYVLRDMTSPQGGFYSAEDADSEGREGLFYVWQQKEVMDILGHDLGALFCTYYNIAEEGNFEDGLSIPHVTTDLNIFAQTRGMEPARMAELLDLARQDLFAAREKRVHPLKDDKVLTAWNGLMITALARASWVLGDKSYLEAAERAAGFVLKNLRDPEQGLMRRWRQGHTIQPGFLDDYAFFTWGLIELYQAGFNLRHLETALELTEETLARFWDDINTGFFYSAHNAEKMIIRDKVLYDGAAPSGNSIAALNLITLARLTGRSQWEDKAWKLLKGYGKQIEDNPLAYTQLLQALDLALKPSAELVLAGDPADEDTKKMLAAARAVDPTPLLLLKAPGEDGERLAGLAPFCREMGMKQEKPTAYLCQGQACQSPCNSLGELERLLTPEGGE